MRYRTKSAEVLNQADALERRLDWMLFASEQNAMLWGGGEGEWVPGTPIYSHPYDGPSEEFPLRSGNHPRQIISIREANDDTLDHEYPPRCETCMVDWRGPEPCFVCGAEILDWRVDTQEQLRSFLEPAVLRHYTEADIQVAGISIYSDYNIDHNTVRFVAEAAWGNSRFEIPREQLLDSANYPATVRHIQDRLVDDLIATRNERAQRLAEQMTLRVQPISADTLRLMLGLPSESEEVQDSNQT